MVSASNKHLPPFFSEGEKRLPVGLAAQQDAGCKTCGAALTRLRSSARVDSGGWLTSGTRVAIAKRGKLATNVHRPASSEA